MEKAYTGRPTKLTDDRSKSICDRLRVVANRDAAAVSAGIKYQTFLNWYKRGEDAAEKLAAGQRIGKLDQAYLKFRDDVDQAEAECELRAEATVAKAMFGYEHVSTTTRTLVVYHTKVTKTKDGTVTERIPETVTVMDTQRSNEFDAKIAIEYLKRRHPDKWSEKQKIEHSGRLDSIVGFEVVMPQGITDVNDDRLGADHSTGEVAA